MAGGRPQPLRRSQCAMGMGAALLLLAPAAAQRQASDPDKFALDAASTTRLAYIQTGDDDSDAIAKAGLFGLSLILTQRTAAELGPPLGLDVEKDELAFFPLLYWRVPPDPGGLSPPPAQRPSDYLRPGGGLLIRNPPPTGFGAAAPTAGGAPP